jgi:hypothetical protein
MAPVGSQTTFVSRLGGWLAGLWAGTLLSVGLVAAPAAFAVLPSSLAGQVVGRLFRQEAYLSLGMAVAMFLIVRQKARLRAEAGHGSVISADVMIVLATLFCTIAGYFAIQPMMAAARMGQGSFSFAALHGVSGGLFALKALLVAALAWRLSSR